MSDVESLGDAERRIATELAVTLSAHASASERAFNSIGTILSAVPDTPLRNASLSLRVSTVLMVRLSNDLRGVALLALRGYALQAAALAASMFETAYCLAYVGSDDERGKAWTQHDDPTQPFRRIKSLVEDVIRDIGLPDAATRSDAEYRVYRQLCLAKHSNPLVQQAHGHYDDGLAVVAMNGPDASDAAVRVARFALEHATRFTILALTSFLNHHVPPPSRAGLSEQVGTLSVAVSTLARVAINEYGNEDPFPGEW